jgi:aquaporin Z
MQRRRATPFNTLPPPLPRAQALLCEFVGTMLLVLTIALSSPALGPTPTPQALALGQLRQCIAVGTLLGGMIYAFDHVSGAFFNPAVTLGAMLNRRVTPGMTLLFTIVQTLGGMAGGLLAAAIKGPNNLQPFQAPSTVPALAVEALYTFALCLVMQNAALEKNSREPNSYFGLAVAFTVLAGATAVPGISGGCFNPAVGTGLNFASLLGATGTMQNVWIYWVAPAVGAVLATVVKIYMNLPSHQEAEGLPLVVPLTEAIGTFFIVLTAALTGEGLAVGAMLLAMVYMGDHVCGADYNPAVTLGVAIRMAVPLREYWKVGVTLLAQFAGAFLAALTAYGVNKSVQYPAQSVSRGVVGATVFEAIWTALLVYVVCAVMTPTHGEEDAAVMEERKGHSRSYQGLAIGFVVAAGIYCASVSGSNSGGVFNPALGTAIMTVDTAFSGKSAADMWIYWVGPFAGSVLGAGLFTLLHFHRDPMILDYEVQLEHAGPAGLPITMGMGGGGGFPGGAMMPINGQYGGGYE